MSQPQVDRLVDRYRRRLLVDRADNIARTEAQTAAAEGRAEGWRQAHTAGRFVEGTVEWVATGDDRLCQLCAPLDGRTAPWAPTATVDGVSPPLHPRCRCVLILHTPGT